MSISPVDASVAQPDPSPVVGKAAPVKDPIVSSGAPVTQPSQTVSDKEVSKAVDALNASSLGAAGLSFSQDKESGLTVVTITDKKTDEVIRQMPTKEALALTHSIDDTLDALRGKLINHKA
ncbi:MAG TPA: flagellar protein FlaG [Herbaspirillum sp.]|jgi:flagellar protein FlaG